MSMMNHPRGLLAILAPCGIVLVVRFVTSLGPNTSAAAVATPGPENADPGRALVTVSPPAPMAKVSDSVAAMKFAQYIASLRQAGRVYSPMDHAPARAAPADPIVPPVPEVAIAPDRTELRLTATMGTGASAAAMINGKILRVGDTIAGLTIISIDSAEFVVTLHAEGGDERILRRR